MSKLRIRKHERSDRKGVSARKQKAKEGKVRGGKAELQMISQGTESWSKEQWGGE